MENHAQITLADQYAAALDWWRDAGVDCDFSDEAQSWLEEPQARQQVQTSSPAVEAKDQAPPPPAITPAELPADLAAFREWWSLPESPLPSGPGPRISARGEAGAALMVLVPMPEGNDQDSLLQGPQGKLIQNILRAIGVEAEQSYFASALPLFMPLPDWSQLTADGLGAAVRHHIFLARPERVLLFGSKLPALLGHDPAAPPESFSCIGEIPALTTFAPERLLDHPRQRARLWQRLLQWNALT